MRQPSRPPAVWVDTPDALARLADRVAAVDRVALDTEANSMHAYREQTCTLQLTIGDHDAIVDALAFDGLDPLRAAFDRPELEVVLHGGDYDVSVLTRDFGWRFHGIFDTMIAATLLGDERVGLASLVEEHVGVQLDKRYQRADWGRRPLSQDHVLYLQRDTIYLPHLRSIYGARLQEADLVEAMAIEMRRLATRQGKPAVVDPEGWRRAKGARRLDDRGRSILDALWAWREEVAAARNLPPFKVLAPAVLVALAENPPRDPRAADALRAVPRRDEQRHGRAIRAALAAGLERHARGDAPGPDAKPRLSAEERAAAAERRTRVDALRAWRKRTAEQQGMTTLAVLPNPAIEWLVDERPRSLDELAACEDLGALRTARYGKALIDLLAD